MQATEELIRNVVKQVLSELNRGTPAAGNGCSLQGRFGVFTDVDQAVAAATEVFDSHGIPSSIVGEVVDAAGLDGTRYVEGPIGDAA